MTEPTSLEDGLHLALDGHEEQDKAASENQAASSSSPQEAIAHDKEQAIDTEKEQETKAAAEAEFKAAWFDATLDASVFFALEHVPPVQAAMLLCQFNPHYSTESEAERGSTDQTSPEDFKRLRTTFLSIDQTKPAHRSMLDWMAMAVGTGLAVHPWAQQYVQHRGLYIAAEPKPTEFALDAGQMSGIPTENPAPAPAPAPAPEPQKILESPGEIQARSMPDPQRRLVRLRELGGDALFKHGKWLFSGINALERAEAAEGRKRRSPKTIRDDLRAAAELERQEKREGLLFSGLGTR